MVVRTSMINYNTLPQLLGDFIVAFFDVMSVRLNPNLIMKKEKKQYVRFLSSVKTSR